MNKSFWHKKNSKNKTVFVHIGMMKTGSSAIQNYLKENNTFLSKNGFYIPKSSSDVGNYLGFSILDKIPPLIHSKYTIGAEKLYKSVWNEIDNVKHDNIIISCEALFLVSSDLFLGEEAVARIYNLLNRENYEIKIIVYVRRQDQFIESWYNQTVKTHNFWNLYTSDIQDFINEKSALLNYSKTLNYWGKYFGKENLIVMDYNVNKENIINSFFNCLDLEFINEEKLEKDKNKDIHNKSLSAFGLKIMKELNKMGINKSNANINSELVKAIELLQRNKNIDYAQFRMSTEERKTVLKNFMDCNEKLSVNYGIDTNSWYKKDDSPFKDTVQADFNKADLLELISIIWNNYHKNHTAHA